MDHYVPEHPLPQEIQSMERDDTVCQFCGVSYLIHNEIKALEDKLATAENELSRLRGCEEREEKLQASLNTAKSESCLLQSQLQDRDSLMAMLQAELEKKSSEVDSGAKERQQLAVDLQIHVDELASMKEDNSHLRQVVTELLMMVKQQKETISAIKRDIQSQVVEFHTSVEKLHATVQLSTTSILQRERDKDTQLLKLTEDIKDQKVAISKLTTQLHEAEAACSEGDRLSAQINSLTTAKDETDDKLKRQKEETETYKTRCLELSSQIETAQDNYKVKSKEFDTVNEQYKLSQQTYESRIYSLDNELTRAEQELERIKSLYDQVVRENEAAVQQRVEKEQMAARSKGETEDMKSKLNRVLGDLEAFKLEREQMITAHQNRIEDLRASFKRKMAEADKWPDKMEAALQRERSKHSAELAALENGMKENFVMEMEIERQKHQKLLDKVGHDMKGEITRLKSQLRAEASSQSELEGLKQQLRTAKADAQGTEARLRSEIENLKNIISNLEMRLGKLDTGDKELMLQLKSQLSDKERSLEDCGDKIRTQDDEINKLKDQLRVLQDTVSRECEERMELIDALGEAREQLLHLQKPAGGYGSSRNSSPQVPASLPAKPSTKAAPPKEMRPTSPASTAGRNSANKEELLLFKKSAQLSSRRFSNSTSGSGSAGSDSREPNITNGNVKSLNFQPEGAKSKPLQGLKTMDSAQKKRIAAILSRNKQ